MIDGKKQEIFSEMDAFLKIIDEEDRLKVPTKLRNLYKENKKPVYNPVYTKKIPIDKQNLKKETIAMLGLLHLNYWCKSEREKAELKNIFIENENVNEKEMYDKYNPNSIFDKSKFQDLPEEKDYMVEYKEPFYIKIINFIKKLFRRK